MADLWRSLEQIPDEAVSYVSPLDRNEDLAKQSKDAHENVTTSSGYMELLMAKWYTHYRCHYPEVRGLELQRCGIQMEPDSRDSYVFL